MDPVTETTATATEEKKPAFDAKALAVKYKDADIITIATAMANATTDEEKYFLAKLSIEKTKSTFIDPMKEVREKEKVEEQKAAEKRAAAVAEYRERITKLFGEELLDEFATIAADYIEAGHGQILNVEVFAKVDPETKKVKAEFSSNIAKPRARTGTSTRTRESGPSGAGVTVQGSPKEGQSGPTILLTEYKSFAEAARLLGFVQEGEDMKGVNCKRLLESKGYTCDYVKVADRPAAAETNEAPATN